MPSRFLNNININDEYSLPSEDGSAGQIIQTNGLGELSFVDQSTINAGNAEHVVIYAKNTSGASISKGTPVYITGTVGATDTVEIAPADAGNSAKMPAVGLLDDTLANNAFGYVITGGFMDNITTDPIDGATPSSNDTVYVKAGGGLTLTKPTGSNLIQNVAKVGKVSGGNAGSLIVSSILRTNDVPNLTTGKIWVGSAANTIESATVHLDEANGRMGIGTTSPNYKLNIVDEQPSDYVGLFIANSRAYGSGQGAYGASLWLGKEENGTNQPMGGITARPNSEDNSTEGHMTFSTRASSSLNERMRITNTGNVGIGTTSPGYKLDVAGTSRIQGTIHMYGAVRNYSGDFSLQNGVQDADILFKVNNGGTTTTAMIVDGATSNVGIGTTGPTAPLHITSSESPGDLLFLHNTQNGAGVGIKFNDNSGGIQDGKLTYRHSDSQSQGGGASFHFTAEPDTTLVLGNSTNKGRFVSYSQNSASEVDYGFGGNVNTGMYSPSSNSVGLVAGGSRKLLVNTDGVTIQNGRLYLGGTVDTNTSSTTALVLNGTEVEKRTLGSAAFSNTGDYVAVAGDTMSGSLDVNADIQANTFTQAATGIPRNNLGSPTVTEMALFDSQFTPKTTLANSYDDLTDLTFWVQTTSSSSWAEVTTYSDDQKRRFLRTNNSSVIIPNGAYKFRVEFNAKSYTFANALYMYWSSQSHNTTVHIWKQRSDNDTWYQHTSSTQNVSSWPGHLWLPFSTIPWHETASTTTHYHKIRVEFEPTWSTGTYADRDILLYGGQIWGGYPSGRRTPHYYDQNGKLSTWGDFDVNGTAIIDGNVGIGTTSPSAKLHVDDGDVIVKNDSTDQYKWQYGSNQPVWSVGGGNYFTIKGGGNRFVTLNSSGNFGIGTTSPLTKLNLADSSSGAILSFKRSNSTTSGAKGGLTWVDSSNYYVAGISASGDGTTDNSGELVFRTSTGEADNTDLGYQLPERMRIDSSGNVGIGTTGPGTKLHVNGGIITVNDGTGITYYEGVKIHSYNTNGYSIIGREGLTLSTASANKDIILSPTGKVGIGTTSPSYKLDVSGTGRFTSTLYTNSGSTSSVGIIGKSQANGWGARYDSNDANYSGFYFDNNNDSSMILRDDAGNVNVWLKSDSSSYFNGGNVGIGTTSPAARLQVTASGLGAKIHSSQTTGLEVSGGGNGQDIARFQDVLGQTKVTIANGGLVGIGTTNPSYKLDVDGQARFGDNGGILLTDDSGTSYVRALNNHLNLRTTRDQDDIYFSTGTTTTTKMFIQGDTGNVGIGTTSPNVQLHVYSTANSEIEVEKASGALINIQAKNNKGSIGTDSNHALNLKTNSSDRLTISNTGNVGIGATSPSEKLEVNGTVKATAATDAYKGYIKSVVNSTPLMKSANTNYNYLPFNTTIFGTTADYYNRITVPYNGRIKKITLRHIPDSNGTVPTATGLKFKFEKNGSVISTEYTATVTGGASANFLATYNFGNSDFTFTQGDYIGVLVQTSGGTGNIIGASAQIVFEYNIT